MTTPGERVTRPAARKAPSRARNGAARPNGCSPEPAPAEPPTAQSETASTAVPSAERRETGSDLLRDGQFLRAVLDSLHEGIVSTDQDGCTVHVNQSARRRLNVDDGPEPFTADNLPRLVHADGVSPMEPDDSPLARARRGERVRDFEMVVVPKDAPPYRVLVNSQPILGPDGAQIGSVMASRDITAQHAAQEALRLSEAGLNEAQQVARMGSWEYRIDLDEIHWSDEHFRLFGLEPSPTPPVYEEYLALLHPDDVPAMHQAIQDCIYLGRPYELEFRVPLRDGAMRWVHAIGRARKDATGRIYLVTGTARDVTESKEAETRLLKEQQFIEALLDSLHEGIVAMDQHGRIQRFNRASRQLHGLAPDAQIDGSPARNFLRTDGVTPIPGDELPLGRALKGEIVRGEEMIIAPPGGPRRWVNVNGQTIAGPNGERLGAVVAIHDITDRHDVEAALRASEQQLHMALKGGRLGEWHMDVAAGVITLSELCAEHLGLAPGSVVRLDEIDKLVHPQDLEQVQQALQSAIDEGHPYEVEGRVVTPDGTIRWIRANCQPIAGPGGRIERLIGLTQDITERKRVEREKERALLEAQERADRDPLTDLLNHRAFHKRMQENLARAAAANTRSAVVMIDIDNFRFFNEAYGHLQGDEILRQVAERLRAICRKQDVLSRYGGDDFMLVIADVGDRTPAQIEERLREQLGNFVYKPDGSTIPVPITLSMGIAIYPSHSVERMELLELADERRRRAKHGSEAETEADRIRVQALKSLSGFTMLDALVTAVDNKDRYTRNHSEDVMTYSMMIAGELGLDEATRHTVAIAALLHDVGKIGVPDTILRKPGSLTDTEMESIKQHPQMGAAIVSAVPGLEDTLDAVLHHHERCDGRGYPFGLRREETPLIARLMAVADAFSAMTTDRPYRKAMHHSRALDILREGCGTQWDPECVEAFLRAYYKNWQAPRS